MLSVHECHLVGYDELSVENETLMFGSLISFNYLKVLLRVWQASDFMS